MGIFWALLVVAHFLKVVYLYVFGQHCSLPVLLVLASLVYCLFM